MRAILALVIIALLMGLAGWLTIGHSSDRTSINIETNEIQRDTENAVDNAERMIKSGARAITEDDTDDGPKVEQSSSEVITSDRVKPVEVDDEPITTVPGETPVSSPAVTP